MNPFLAAVMMGRTLHLTRVCPKCQRSQLVSSNRKKDTVPCKFCGADLPPKRKEG